MPFVAHSGFSRTSLVYEVEGREAKRSIGVFSLIGERTAPMAFNRPEDGKPVCRILGCEVALEVKDLRIVVE